MRECFDGVHILRTSELFAAFAEEDKNRDAAANRVFHVDFRARILFVADDYGGAADIFEAPILDPQFVEIPVIDGNCRRDILELRADQGQPRLMLPYSGFALAFKGAVNHGELPTGRRLAGPYPVFAAIKMQILRHVAAIVNSGEA